MSLPTTIAEKNHESIHDSRSVSGSMVAIAVFTAVWAAVLVVVCLLRNGHYVYDDTFITLRYVRHLLQGHGPVWNLQGVPVEGFSSPLHLLVVSAVGWAGVPLLLAARIVGYASHAVLVAFIFLWMNRRSGLVPASLATALVACSWPILVWDAGGLDAVLFTAFAASGTLITLSYIESESRRGILWGGVLLGVGIFVRPDGVVFVAAALISCLVLAQVALRRRIQDVVVAGLLCVVINLPWEIFRLSYFHLPLANTYYAKIVGIPLHWRLVSGFEYWRSYAREAPFLPILLFVAAAIVVVRRRSTRFDLGLWVAIVLYAAYVVVSGGDHMMAFRFMIPLIPLLAVALVRAAVLCGVTSSANVAVALSLLLALASARQMSPMVENPEIRDWAGLMGEVIGNYITTNWRPGSLVAVNVAGTTAYFADRMEFIDMLGLNDRTIAMRNPVPLDLPTIKLVGHLKGDGAYVFARQPEYVIPRGGNGPFPTLKDTDDSLGEYELIRQPGFATLYRQCEIMLSVPPEIQMARLPNSFAFDFYKRSDVNTDCPAPRPRG